MKTLAFSFFFHTRSVRGKAGLWVEDSVVARVPPFCCAASGEGAWFRAAKLWHRLQQEKRQPSSPALCFYCTGSLNSLPSQVESWRINSGDQTLGKLSLGVSCVRGVLGSAPYLACRNRNPLHPVESWVSV